MLIAQLGGIPLSPYCRAFLTREAVTSTCEKLHSFAGLRTSRFEDLLVNICLIGVTGLQCVLVLSQCD